MLRLHLKIELKVIRGSFKVMLQITVNMVKVTRGHFNVLSENCIIFFFKASIIIKQLGKIDFI